MQVEWEKDLVHETVLSELAMPTNPSLGPDSGNSMLDFDPNGGNGFVFILLICGKLLSPRLLSGLNDGHITRCIALITDLLPQDAGIWNSALCLCDCLVMRLTGTVAPTNKTSSVKVVITAFLTVCFFFFRL